MLKIAEYNTITGKKVELSVLEKYGFIVGSEDNGEIIYTRSCSDIYDYILIPQYKEILKVVNDDETVTYACENDVEDLIKDGYVVKE